MGFPKTVEDVIFILDNAERDEPEGSCYKRFSCTLCRMMVVALKGEEKDDAKAI